MSDPQSTPQADRNALHRAIQSGDVTRISAVLFPKRPLAFPSPPTPPGDSVIDLDTRPLTVHFLNRFTVAVRHGWRVDPDELPVLLNLLEAYQSDLKLREDR